MAASSTISGQVPCTATDPAVPGKFKPVAADNAGSLYLREGPEILDALHAIALRLDAVIIGLQQLDDVDDDLLEQAKDL